MGGGAITDVNKTECRQKFLEEVSARTGWDLAGYDFVPDCKEYHVYPGVLLCTNKTKDTPLGYEHRRIARAFTPTPKQLEDPFLKERCPDKLQAREMAELVAYYGNDRPPFSSVMYYLLRSEWYFCGDPATEITGPSNLNSTNLIIDKAVFEYLRSLYDSCE